MYFSYVPSPLQIGVLDRKGIALFKYDFYTTMLHEVGHSFAGLVDEYGLNNSRNPYPRDSADLAAYLAKSPNLDGTSNLEEIKWKKLIDLEGYEDVNAFEGGGYSDTYIWRPAKTSIMRRSSYEFFNAPSREAIVRRIMRYSKNPIQF